jgi:uncharacterized cupredoxin-like copper-binding protein
MHVIRRIAFVLVATLFSPAAYAHGDDGSSRSAARFDPSRVEQTPFGREGDPSKAQRTVVVRMSDQMRFSPDVIKVSKGETIRLVVANDGEALHELVLGRTEDLKEHAELMRRFPGMVHVEPHIAHVKPGNQREIVWHFNRPGTFSFACLQPGHYEAGMLGYVAVR